MPLDVFLIYQNSSEAEQKELEQLRKTFPEPRFELDSQCAESDEPWCLVYDNTFDKMVLRLARIGSRYVVALEGQPATSHSNLSDAIRLALSRAEKPPSAREVA
jgi:hypothetical protein